MNNFVSMIDHDGFIARIENDVAQVKIVSESACAACHAKGVCGAADQEEKSLDIPLQGREFSVGEQVRVLVEKRLGLKAVALGYVYPLLVLMTVLIILITIGLPELKAAPLALLSLPVYYALLYAARNKIERSFTFSIEKQKDQ